MSRAIPQLKGAEPPNRLQHNTATFQALYGQMNKLEKFCDFQETAINILQQNVLRLSQSQSDLIPEGLYSVMIKVIDLLAIQDNLKDMKVCQPLPPSMYARTIVPKL